MFGRPTHSAFFFYDPFPPPQTAQGVFVLQDNNYQWLWSLSSVSAADHEDEIQAHASFSCGFVMGAFASLGRPCTVVANTSNLPTCAYFFYAGVHKPTLG